MKHNKSIIIFDGICMLCNNSVDFIIKHDRERKFKFAALQWDASIKILSDKKLNQTANNSIILIENQKIYTSSTAVLRILKRLPLPYYLMYGLIIIPPFIRNPIYNLISKKRYKWFGKKDSCTLPSKEPSERFLQ